MSKELKKMYKTVMDDHFPSRVTISFGNQTLEYRKKTWQIADNSTGELIEKGLRYGENPGQEAALYELTNGNLTLGECRFIESGKGLVSSLTEEQLIQSGKHPGKTNLTDIDNALNILKYLVTGPAAVIVKHNNPCGVSYGSTIANAYQKANMSDRIAAFGGCAVFNRAINKETAELISDNYLEVVVAPEFENGTIPILSKSSNLRIIKINKIDKLSEYTEKRFVEFKSLIDGGIILQQSPVNKIKTVEDFEPASSTHNGKLYTARKPTKDECNDMLFGWQVEQGITSNSVIYVKNGTTIGIGTGEQDRVGVAEIAIYKAYTKYADSLCFNKYGISYKDIETEITQGKKDAAVKEEIDKKTAEDHGGLTGSSMISDAFFPFRDGVDVAIKEGISAIVHPGGSMRDFESIEACNEANPRVTMVFTGQRAFKH